LRSRISGLLYLRSTSFAIRDCSTSRSFMVFTFPSARGILPSACMAVSLRQPVDRERGDDEKRHGLVRWRGEGLLDSRLQHQAAIDRRRDALEDVDVVRMGREKTGELIHLLVHVIVELG